MSEYAHLISLWIEDWFLGALIMAFSMIVSRHLTNVLMFRFVRRNPSLISGESEMKHVLVLKLSQYQFLAVLVPMTIIVVLIPHPFLVGCITGLLLLIFLHGFWIRINRRS